MRLVVALSIFLVTIVGDSKEVLVGATLVTLIVAAIEFVELWIEGQLTTVDNLVGIRDSFLQTTVCFRELRISLTIGDGLNLCCSQWVVTPYQIGTSQ